jgi:hypothetical protein
MGTSVTQLSYSGSTPGNDNDYLSNIAILAEQIQKEAWYDTHWAALAGFTNVARADKDLYSPYNYKISGKPIEILKNFSPQGGSDHILMPFGRRPTINPVFGNEIVKGTGNEASKYWLRAFVNVVRGAVKPKSGLLSEYRTNPLGFMKDAKPDLVEFWAQYYNQDIYRAFYEGIGLNLSTGTFADTDDDHEQGLGIKKRYHPNWFYYNAGGTAIADVGTANQCKTAAELDTAIALPPADMDAKALKLLATKLKYLKISKIITIGGKKYWKIIMHTKQLEDLENDTTYQNAVNTAYTGTKGDHPELNGLISTYRGFAIYEDLVGIRSWDDSNDHLFGTGVADTFQTSLTPVGVSEDNYNAIVVGNSAIGLARPRGISFTQEVDDHEAIVELATTSIFGANRVDICTAANIDTVFARGEAAAAVVGATVMENTSSLVFMTG